MSDSQRDGDTILHQAAIEAIIDERLGDQGSSEPTIYTIGPAAGSYDIEWPASGSSAHLDFPSWATDISGLRPRLTVVGNVAFLTGNIEVTADAVSNGVGFALPDDLCPAVEVSIPVVFNDTSEGLYAPAVLTVYTGPGGSIQVARMDGLDFDDGDSLVISAPYLLATS